MPSASRWWTESTEITRSQGPSGNGSSIRAEAHLLPAELAGLEDHLRGRVEAGDPRLGEAVEQSLGGLGGAEAQLEHPFRRERDRVDRALLELVVAGDVGADHLRVRLGSSETGRLVGGAHRVANLDSESRMAAYTTIDAGPDRPSPGDGKRLEVEVEPGPVSSGGRRYASEPRTGGAPRCLAHGDRLRAALRSPASVDGPCMRCLGRRGSPVEVDAREVDQPRHRRRGAAQPLRHRRRARPGPGRATRWSSRCPSSCSAVPTAPGSARSAASRSTTPTRAPTTTRASRPAVGEAARAQARLMK